MSYLLLIGDLKRMVFAAPFYIAAFIAGVTAVFFERIADLIFGELHD